MRLIGKGPWPNNPKYCGSCLKQLMKHHGGAEIDCSLLFADVRGSTPLAETMRPAAFRGLMERFFDIAAEVLVEHDAIVDKFVGDEIIGIFVPALSGDLHAARAIAAARTLLVRMRADERTASASRRTVRAPRAHRGAGGVHHSVGHPPLRVAEWQGA